MKLSHFKDADLAYIDGSIGDFGGVPVYVTTNFPTNAAAATPSFIVVGMRRARRGPLREWRQERIKRKATREFVARLNVSRP